MQTFQEYKSNPSSEKLVLAWLEPSQRLFTWAVHSGAIYTRSVAYYVVGVRQDAIALTSVASLAAVTGAGKYYFDADTLTLYVWATGSVSPATVWTDVTYRLFYSNAPIDLPADLVAAKEVPYDARLKKTGKFKAKFDADQKGVALEGTGRIDLHNEDGHFESTYDRLVWENKEVQIFSYNRELPVSEKVTLFKGVISNKDYSDSAVSFEVKDFIYKLRTAIDLPVYAATDGALPDSLLGKSKRRIYGRVDGLICDPVSTMRSEYELRTIDVNDLRTATPITISLTTGSTTATSSSTDVHKELVAGDELTIAGTKHKVKSLSRVDIGLDTPKDVTASRTSAFVARIAFTGITTTGVTVGDAITLAVLSNASQDTKSKIIGHFPIAVVNAAYLEFTLPTSIAALSDVFKTGVGEIAVTRQTNTTTFTLQQASAITTTASAMVKPSTPYRRFNREYLLAHHALSTRSTTITNVISSVKFAVSNVSGFYEGDVIRLNSLTLTSIVGLNVQAKIIEVADTILPFPVIGDTVERLGIQNVTFKEREFTPFDDYNPSYDALVGSKITFEVLAEFNAAPLQVLTSNVSWRDDSKQVLGSNNVFRNIQVRDWIKPSTDTDWYEVGEKFSDNLVILSVPYNGTTAEAVTTLKQPVYLQDASIVIADVYGRTVEGTEAGTHISTAADIVKDLLTDAGVGALINVASFTTAAESAPYRMSLAIPYEKTSPAPKFRDVITRINDSVQGSLFNTLDMTIAYQVVDASRTLNDATVLTDADVLSSSVATDSSNILSKCLVRFAVKDADTVTEKATYSVAQSESDFTLYSGIEGQIDTVQTALYDREDAETVAQRIVFINEFAKSTVTVITKLTVADNVLNDLVSVGRDRTYQRFGTSGSDKVKLGLISAIDKDGLSCKATIDDLGNLFNRVAVIAADDTPEYSAATEEERRYAGFITDNSGLVDDETTFNANLIG